MHKDWKILISPDVEKKIKKLLRDEQNRVRRAINRLETKPQSANLKRLKGRPEWSLRIGKWRMLFWPDVTDHALVAVEFGPRGDIYK